MRMILTREENDYDQSGEYFVAFFEQEPIISDIKHAIKMDTEDEISDEIASHIISHSGGRINNENTWWYLRPAVSLN